MNETEPRTPRGNLRWGFGLIAMAAGVAALIRLHPEALRAPAWVAYVAAFTFGIAGMVLLATGAGKPRLASWLAVALVAMMALPGAWIALGAGERRCTANVPLLALPSATVCRTVFGVGALILVILVVYFARLAATRRPAS